ncbi:MAG: hypothetical protein KGD68_06095 [Candidatus Lokiarchaeota archaeon]|nr:hypothetical protein [Candidatus Lokiarchaeota archaeon]
MISFDNILLVTSASVACVLNIIGFLLSFSYAKKRKNRLVYLFSANWLLQSFFWALDGASHLYYSTLLMILAIIPQVIGVPCLFIFIDLIKKERVSSIKITILLLIEITLLYLTFMPESMQIIPGYGVHNVGVLRIFQIIFLFYYVMIYFSWSYLTWKRAPNELKQLVNFLLFGSILFSFVTASLYFLGTYVKIFNSLGFITHSLGALFTIIVIWKEPKIIFILPFKAYRLLVVETNAGIGLFKHDWAKLKAVDENVFTMVLQAVGSILDELLKKGEIREIKMDRAVLIIQHNKNYPVASILVTTKSSKSLRNGLKKFNSQFIDKFKSHFGGLFEVSRFKEARALVEEFFDFVPDYLEK